jgi:hypothetical protein
VSEGEEGAQSLKIKTGNHSRFCKCADWILMELT